MSDINDLHDEFEILRVKASTITLAKHFFSAAIKSAVLITKLHYNNFSHHDTATK